MDRVQCSQMSDVSLRFIIIVTKEVCVLKDKQSQRQKQKRFLMENVENGEPRFFFAQIQSEVNSTLVTFQLISSILSSVAAKAWKIILQSSFAFVVSPILFEQP